MKRTGTGYFLLFVFIAVMLFLSAARCENNTESSNLLYNGDFEITGADALPDGWLTEAYRMNPGYSVFCTAEGMKGKDSKSVSIRNVSLNDARFLQTVEVEPETMYCLSGYVRTSGISEGHGANLSIEGIYGFSKEIFDTEDSWEKVEYYGETGPDQYEITVFARVGGYSGESKGEASFDSLSLKAVDELPEGVIADLWFHPESYGADDEDVWDSGETSKQTGSCWPALFFILILYSMAFASVIHHLNKNKTSGQEAGKNKKAGILLVMTSALLLRIVLCFLIEGYSVDVNCFRSWGYTMAHNGPSGFYQATSFCDYPPLYMYSAGLSSWLSDTLKLSDGLARVAFRLFPCLCDVAGCVLLLKYAERKTRKESFSAAVIFLFAFNPATVLNSAAWGQMDSVLCLALLAVALFASEKKWIFAVSFYVTAVLIKPQALMLGPLGLIYMIMSGISDRKEWKGILTGTGTGILLIILYILPFGIHQEPGWLISLYSKTLSSYPYATVNTANLYYLAGGNWSAVGNTAHFSVSAFFAAACAAHGVWLIIRNKEKKYIWVEAALAGAFTIWFILCGALGLSWVYPGTGAMVYAFLIVISMAVRKKDIRFLPYLGALLFILLYVFGVKMHERYLFPAFLLLLFSWVLQKDRRILYLLLLFSGTVFINEGIVLDNSIRLGAELGHLNPDTAWLADILCILNISGALMAVSLGYSLMSGHPAKEFLKIHAILPVRTLESGRKADEYHPDHSLYWKRKDTVILLCITAMYSILALTTLGSSKAPQTAWSSSGDEEQIVFDLLEERDDVRMLYFGQVSQRNFTVAQSSDGRSWSDEVYAQMNQGQCWKWKYVTQSWDDGTEERSFNNSTDYIVHFSGRYIRLSSCQVGLTLNEIIFRDPSGNTIPARILQRTGNIFDSALNSDPEKLLDEQDTMEKLPSFSWTKQEGETQPSWWNSTYFDEIYHARTGFEFTKGSVPYETSHPPLGKIFISWCISAFGMTPFGWRFAGAAAGILMLPGIYLLAKQLSKKTWIAGTACGLLALDCMHLTQSQIATIDSFPVLFIIFAFFFMLRFIQTDLSACRFRTAAIPLACSGFFMGLSIASKWIGIYAGIGLAILYFWHCIRSVCIAGSRSEQGKTDVFRRVLILSMWCVLFFVVIPAALYLLSYIPYMAYNTRIRSLGDYLNAVWRAQESMLSYHSTPGLGMDHPFYSPWWEWPIIGKPMFYATEQYIPKEAYLHHSIFSFGNPVVWWGALASVPAALYLWAREKHYRINGSEERWHILSCNWDIRFEFVFIGLLSQYLPWVLVPRGTYIYHYFASVPFLILLISVCLTGESAKHEKTYRIAGWIVIAAAGLLFVLLLPYTTGIAAPAGWLEIGKNVLHIWY